MMGRNGVLNEAERCADCSIAVGGLIPFTYLPCKKSSSTMAGNMRSLMNFIFVVQGESKTTYVKLHSVIKPTFFIYFLLGIQPVFHQAVYHGVFTVLYSVEFFFFYNCRCVSLVYRPFPHQQSC